MSFSPCPHLNYYIPNAYLLDSNNVLGKKSKNKKQKQSSIWHVVIWSYICLSIYVFQRYWTNTIPEVLEGSKSAVLSEAVYQSHKGYSSPASMERVLLDIDSLATDMSNLLWSINVAARMRSGCTYHHHCFLVWWLVTISVFNMLECSLLWKLLCDNFIMWEKN